MKKVLLSMAMLVIASASYAQLSAVKEAKGLIGKDSKRAESVITPALTNPETMNQAETWNTAGQIYKKWAEQETQNQALQRNFDEEGMYHAALKMVEAFAKCDELAELPNEKGKVNNKYRNANASAIQGERGTLVNGGIYYINKDGVENQKKAVELLGTYVTSAKLPMMEKFNLMATDTLIPQIAYYACIAAMRAEDYASLGKYAEFAALNPEYGQETAEWLAASYQQSGDTEKYLEALKAGNAKYPNDRYFFANIVGHYIDAHDYAGGMAFADETIAKDPSSYNLYVKGYLYRAMQQYDNAIEILNKSIAADPTNADAYSNLGDVYCLQAQDFSAQATTNMNDPKYNEDQKTLRGFYEKAREPYEKARQYAPDKTNLWMSGLYRVYYNLNMENEFNEIEKLMNN